MKSIYHRQLAVFLLIFFFPLNCISQGLLFHGLETTLQERSTLSVFNNKNCLFKNSFEINFKFSLYNIDSYGYIFLLEDAKSGVAYNLMYMYESKDYSLLNFNIGAKDNLLAMRIDNRQLEKRRWVSFSLRFDLKADSVCITIDGKPFSKKNLNLPESLEANLSVGFIKDYVELPTFGLRDLEVGNAELHYRFPLNESAGNGVHDSEGNVVGTVSNPVWLINAAYHWKLRFAADSLPLNGANYRASTQSMLFFHQHFISTYDMLTDSSTIHKYANLIPLSIWLGTSFLDERNNKLYAYEIRDCKDCQGSVSSLDLDSYEWHPLCNDWLPMQLHHHSGYFDAGRNRYIIFGGFGNRQYNRDFFTFDLSTQKWDTLQYTGDKINPRYFQGMAASQDNLYILGGMGNDAGCQKIGRRNYYDLYKLDLEGKKCTKLWEIDWKKKNVVLARNMVAFGDSLLYALCYPEYESITYAQLYKFSIKDGSYEILGDSIRFCSEEILTNINLFYDSILQQFYCVVQEVNKNDLTNSRVYSLASPGVSKKNLSVYEQQDSEPQTLLYLMIFLSCLLALFIYKFLFRRKHVQKAKKVDLQYAAEDGMNNRIQRKESAVYLLGELTLFDKTGKDITYMLSTRLKNTFLIILEHSLSKGGITSTLLSDMLWYDRDKYSAKDLRGVTINQLRKILSEVNGLRLVFDKGLYRLIVEDECFCDCKYLLELIDLNIRDKRGLHEINDILSRGIFLNSLDEPILESFKLFVKEKLITNLPIYIQKAFKLNDYLLVVQLSDHLLLIDPLNITVFSFQLRSLYALNQEIEASKRYTLFSHNYNKLTNQFPQNLVELLNYTK